MAEQDSTSGQSPRPIMPLGPVSCTQEPHVLTPMQVLPIALLLFWPLHGASVSAKSDPGWLVWQMLDAGEKSKNA